MTLVDDHIANDPSPADAAGWPWRPWRWFAAAAGVAAVLTAALAISTAAVRDGGSTIVAQSAQLSTPSSTVPPASVTDVIPEPAPAPAPERLSESSRLQLTASAR